MLSFICWVIVVALFCVAAWRIARRRYTGGLAGFYRLEM